MLSYHYDSIDVLIVKNEPLKLVIVWFTLVHRGSNMKKGCIFMEFKDFFSMMKNRISDGADVPTFFRILIEMITDVDESEWGTEKDPSTKLTKDNTLRTYSKRTLSKNLRNLLCIVYALKHS